MAKKELFLNKKPVNVLLQEAPKLKKQDLPGFFKFVEDKKLGQLTLGKAVKAFQGYSNI